MVAEKKSLTNLQVELLKLFVVELPEEQLMEIRQILAHYFAQKATEEMDKLWEKNGWTNETVDIWLNERMRTPY